MIARMRWTSLWAGAVVVTLGLLILGGCRSNSGLRSGGCGGSCCRGQKRDAPIAPPAGETVAYNGAVRPNAGAAAGPTNGAASTDVRPYGGQKTCPVMGEELGSMGPAIPVTVKGQTVYVCCRGCAAKVQRDPDTYLAKAMAERSGR